MKDKTILFGNGDYTDREYYRKILDESDYYIIAIDGGLNLLAEIEIRPDLILGDYDSVNSDLLEQFTGIERLSFPTHKDLTDSEIGLEEAIKRKPNNKIVLAGMSGGRIDHWLANILLLKKYAQEGINISMISPKETLLCFKGPEDIKLSEPLQTKISLIPMSKEVKGVTLTGFEYPLKDATLSERTPGLGLSNVTIAISQTIQFKTGSLLVVIEYQDR